MNMFQMPIGMNQINNPMKMGNPMGMNNMMMNDQMGMNNMMMNNPMGMNNMMMNNPMGMNNMMMNNPMGMNNMMMNEQMGMNNMIMNNPMGMNNMINISMPNINQIMMNQNQQKINDQNQINMPNRNEIPKKKHNRERKIPRILQKNANIQIESITFRVEKDKKPTGELLPTKDVNYIFNGLFQKRKKGLNEKGKLVYLNENEPMEILHHKFDTNQAQFFNFGKKSLIQGLVLAYKIIFR